MDIIFPVVILIVSVILHEVAHGYMASYLGDPTARLQGRLTLNPLVHIDAVGSILIPAILVFSHSPFLIGYAKPVPYNPYNLSGKYDELFVAGAGPATNILLALLFGLAIRFGGEAMATPMLSAFTTITYINILLALFNLIPIPPLDGSKVLSGILGRSSLGDAYNSFRISFEKFGIFSGTLILLVLFYFILAPFFSVLLGAVFSLITGL